MPSAGWAARRHVAPRRRRLRSASAASAAGLGGAGAAAAALVASVNAGLGSLETAPAFVHLAHLLVSGCGAPLSEDALCVSAGAFLSRAAARGGAGAALPRALEVVPALYVGVVASDLITYAIGAALSRGFARGLLRLLRRSGSTERATRIVREYGVYIGFVERFFIGFRGAIALMSGFLRVDFASFARGVAAGALLTLPLQLGAGHLLLRDSPRPYLTALAMVATPNLLGNCLGAVATAAAAWRAAAAAARGREGD